MTALTIPLTRLLPLEEAITRAPDLIEVLEMAMLYQERDGCGDERLRTLVELIREDAHEVRRMFLALWPEARAEGA